MTNWVDLENIPSILQDIAQVLFASMFIGQFFTESPNATVIIYGFILSLFLWLGSLVTAKQFKINK